ncbi:hypothetical protein ACH5RR_040806 [Cinchona calisaya]|uniref:Uncharacterized protein n=1 Tax=Cinchona calisaya TaxID=153742 RepID=A0ABD2XSG0_9GENT
MNGWSLEHLQLPIDPKRKVLATIIFLSPGFWIDRRSSKSNRDIPCENRLHWPKTIQGWPANPLKLIPWPLAKVSRRLSTNSKPPRAKGFAIEIRKCRYLISIGNGWWFLNSAMNLHFVAQGDSMLQDDDAENHNSTIPLMIKNFEPVVRKSSAQQVDQLPSVVRGSSVDAL